MIGRKDDSPDTKNGVLQAAQSVNHFVNHFKLERERQPVQFHANHVSSSAEGDYYQLKFEAVVDSMDPEDPYLIVQRQFEDSDDDQCYIETHDENYVGHSRIRRLDFAAARLLLELERPKFNVVEVTFVMASSEIQEVARVVGIISGEIEAP